MRLYKGVFTFSVTAYFFVSVPVFAGYAVFPSTPPPQAAEKAFPSSDLNAPGALHGVIAPWGLLRRDWSAQFVLFSDSLGGLPAFEIGSDKGKNSLRLLYSDSALPRLKDEGSFLRANGVGVKESTTFVIIGHSTVTYSSDAVYGFRTRTRSLALYFGRELYRGEFASLSLLAGIGSIYRFYSIHCLLADNSNFGESSSSYGFLFSPGLKINLGAPSAIKRGFGASLYCIYNKVWLPGGDKKLAGALRKELENLRFGFGLGWRFNFYD